MTPEPLIELHAVSKRFGTRTAVDGLSLGVGPGDIYGLLGHNGAGKSTAIGMMLGQVWPSAGTIRVCGHDVTAQRSAALRDVGAIFESPVFYDYLSGSRNLEILAQYTAPTPRRRILEVIEWVGLSGREHSKVRTYSHGMRARLALAQALLPQPRLLILDEPSDGLDPEGIHEVRQTIRRLHRELGLTLLLSSHLLNEVEQLCNRICVLHQGVKVFEGLLTEARQPQRWVRLRLDDFSRGVARLVEDGLITGNHDGRFVTPAPGIPAHRLVHALVHAGFAVHEVVAHEPTLEEFYLDLMQQQRRPSPPELAPAGPPNP